MPDETWSQRRAAQRKRGREERRVLGHLEAREPLPLDDGEAFIPRDDVADPGAYLEKQRIAYIDRLERIAARVEAADPVLTARICLDLLKLTSTGRARLDVTVKRHQELPDLSHLSLDDLQQLALPPATADRDK